MPTYDKAYFDKYSPPLPVDAGGEVAAGADTVTPPKNDEDIATKYRTSPFSSDYDSHVTLLPGGGFTKEPFTKPPPGAQFEQPVIAGPNTQPDLKTAPPPAGKYDADYFSKYSVPINASAPNVGNPEEQMVSAPQPLNPEEEPEKPLGAKLADQGKRLYDYGKQIITDPGEAAKTAGETINDFAGAVNPLGSNPYVQAALDQGVKLLDPEAGLSPSGDNFTKALEYFRALETTEQAKREMRSPVAAAAGNFLGNAVVPLPGGEMQGALGGLTRLTGNTVIGGLMGAGGSKEPFLSNNYLSDAAKGAVTGGVLGGILEAPGALGGAREGLDNLSNSLALKQLNPGKTASKEIAKMGVVGDPLAKVREIGQDLHAQGITGWLKSPRDMLKQLEPKVEAIGKDIHNQLVVLGDFAKNPEVQAHGINPHVTRDDVINATWESMETAKIVAPTQAIYQKSFKEVTDYLNALPENMTLAEANTQKVNFGLKVKRWGPNKLEEKDLVEQIYRGLNDAIETKVNTLGLIAEKKIQNNEMTGNPLDLEEYLTSKALIDFKESKRLYGNLEKARAIAEDSSARSFANNIFGLTSFTGGLGIGGLIGAQTGSTGLAVAAAGLGGLGAREVGRRYGIGASSMATKKAANILGLLDSATVKAGFKNWRELSPAVIAEIIKRASEDSGE